MRWIVFVCSLVQLVAWLMIWRGLRAEERARREAFVRRAEWRRRMGAPRD